MKKAAWVPIVILLALAAGCIVYVPTDESGRTPSPRDEETYYGDEERDVSVFYDDLAPFGTWVDFPRYGFVWIPRHMPYGWRPYTNGRWVWSDYGWTWISSFEWGWIPFHYGRWGFDRSLGWFWVPDTIWGPAWVAWRTGDSHLGWAPLPPDAEFIPGMGIRSSGFDIPPYYWIFVDGRNFWNDRLDRYVLPYERNQTIINYTVINVNIRAQDDRVYNEDRQAGHEVPPQGRRPAGPGPVRRRRGPHPQAGTVPEPARPPEDGPGAGRGWRRARRGRRRRYRGRRGTGPGEKAPRGEPGRRDQRDPQEGR
jgi:hypothetical protein